MAVHIFKYIVAQIVFNCSLFLGTGKPKKYLNMISPIIEV